MRNRLILPILSPERWPWIVLAVGGTGVLVSTIGAFVTALGVGWRRFALSFLGNAAFDFATVLALFFVLRVLVNSRLLRR